MFLLIRSAIDCHGFWFGLGGLALCVLCRSALSLLSCRLGGRAWWVGGWVEEKRDGGECVCDLWAAGACACGGAAPLFFFFCPPIPPNAHTTTKERDCHQLLHHAHNQPVLPIHLLHANTHDTGSKETRSVAIQQPPHRPRRSLKSKQACGLRFPPTATAAPFPSSSSSSSPSSSSSVPKQSVASPAKTPALTGWTGTFFFPPSLLPPSNPPTHPPTLPTRQHRNPLDSLARRRPLLPPRPQTTRGLNQRPDYSASQPRDSHRYVPTSLFFPTHPPTHPHTSFSFSHPPNPFHRRASLFLLLTHPPTYPGSSVVKLPQIWNILRSSSVVGLSLLSLNLEVACGVGVVSRLGGWVGGWMTSTPALHSKAKKADHPPTHPPQQGPLQPPRPHAFQTIRGVRLHPPPAKHPPPPPPPPLVINPPTHPPTQVLYNLHAHTPFKQYGESVFILLQNTCIILLYWALAKPSVPLSYRLPPTLLLLLLGAVGWWLPEHKVSNEPPTHPPTCSPSIQTQPPTHPPTHPPPPSRNTSC